MSARLHIDELGRLMTVKVPHGAVGISGLDAVPGGSAPSPPAFFALSQQHGRENKSEIRDSIPRRWERAPKGTKGHSVETQSGSSDRRQRFDHWGLGDWDLFRNLDLRSCSRGVELPIPPCYWPKAINLGGSGAEPLSVRNDSHACACLSWTILMMPQTVCGAHPTAVAPSGDPRRSDDSSLSPRCSILMRC